MKINVYLMKTLQQYIGCFIYKNKTLIVLLLLRHLVYCANSFRICPPSTQIIKLQLGIIFRADHFEQPLTVHIQLIKYQFCSYWSNIPLSQSIQTYTFFFYRQTSSSSVSLLTIAPHSTTLNTNGTPKWNITGHTQSWF